MAEPALTDDLASLSDLIIGFDHVAFAVRDLIPTVQFFQSLGGEFLEGGDNRKDGFRFVQFVLPGATKVEAIAPITDDCFLHDFLDGRGEGIHHLTFRVRDVVEAARRAEAQGLRVVGLFTELITWKECFIHPSSAHGTVVQLAQWPDKDQPPPSLAQVLAGEVHSPG